jgi:membrane-associated protease RseP (regulator of RpoE activity)
VPLDPLDPHPRPSGESDRREPLPPGDERPLGGWVGSLARGASRLGWKLNLILLAATFVSTTLCGALFLTDPGPGAGAAVGAGRYLAGGLQYALAVLAILGAHEMGHYLYCRWYGVDATLPYFIPAPFLFGTMGAVIRMRPPLPGRKALFDIGIAGPIAGFVVALPVLVYGIATARVEPLPTAPGPYYVFGDPLLVSWMTRLFHGELTVDRTLVLNPFVAAGWFGLLVTAMNLFPVGQLDGGHVIFALSARAHRIVSRLTVDALLAFVTGSLAWGLAGALFGPAMPPIAAALLGASAALAVRAAWGRLTRLLARAALLAAGLFLAVCFTYGVFSPWLLWMALLFLLVRMPHPPVERADDAPGRLRGALALVALAILVVSFTPVPIDTVVIPGTG